MYPTCGLKNQVNVTELNNCDFVKNPYQNEYKNVSKSQNQVRHPSKRNSPKRGIPKRMQRLAANKVAAIDSIPQNTELFKFNVYIRADFNFQMILISADSNYRTT